ncbi:MAG: integrase arm-type DNA-binding domain-containing protein [Methylococcales bacterium]
MLSDTTTRSAKTNPDKAYKLPGEKGMYVLIHQNGSKYFRLNYRFAGKRKTLPLGVYPETSLKAARDKRDIARKQLADGIDPAEFKKTKRQEIVTKQNNAFNLVFERWLAVNQKWGDKYREDVRACVTNHILPFIGDISMNEITRDHLIVIINRLKAIGESLIFAKDFSGHPA